jgi:hypothetical protein
MDWLCTNFATVNIVVFVVSEILVALAVLLGLSALRRGANENAGNPGSAEWTAGFVYRSAEMERRRTGVSDRRRAGVIASKRLFVPEKRERRTLPDRRTAPWDLHLA